MSTEKLLFTKQSGSSPKCQTPPCLTSVLWKYQVSWEIHSPVITDEVIGAARIL